MRKIAALSLGIALAVVVALPAIASAKMVKQCKDLEITEIKNCASCHTSKSPKDMNEKDLNEVGKWLREQKEAKKAGEYDMSWLKEYFADKK